MARFVKGDSRLRRTLRRMPDEITSGVRKEMTAIGRELATAITATAPKDTGGMAQAADYKVSSDGLAVKAGYSAKAAGFKRNWKKGGFKSLWAEFGTKRVAAQPFLRPLWRARIRNSIERIDRAVTAALRKAQANG